METAVLVIAALGVALVGVMVLRPPASSTRGPEPYPSGGNGGSSSRIGGSSTGTSWYNTAGRSLGGLLEGIGDFGGSGSGGQMGGSGVGGAGTASSQYR